MLNAVSSAIAGIIPAPRTPRALRVVQTFENHMSQEQVPLREPIINGGSPSSTPDNEVFAPTVAPRQIAHCGTTVPLAGPGEGTTNDKCSFGH